MDKREKSH